MYSTITAYVLLLRVITVGLDLTLPICSVEGVMKGAESLMLIDRTTSGSISCGRYSPGNLEEEVCGSSM